MRVSRQRTSTNRCTGMSTPTSTVRTRRSAACMVERVQNDTVCHFLIEEIDPHHACFAFEVGRRAHNRVTQANDAARSNRALELGLPRVLAGANRWFEGAVAARRFCPPGAGGYIRNGGLANS